MEESHMFNHESQGTVLGTYSTEEWVIAEFLRERYLRSVTTTQVDATWLIPAGFTLQEFVSRHDSMKQYTFFSANRVLVKCTDGLIKITSGRGKIEVELIGCPAWANACNDLFAKNFKKATSLIEWVYSTQGHEITVPLNFRPAIQSAYPWIQKPIVEYIDDYLNSEASVLILIGPPGTGKTTLLKNIIHRSGGNAKVAYDEKVMRDDGLFATFIDDESRFLIMEDADAFLESRADGNTMMHKFLNVSDGLISAASKKLVFSTNLPNVSDIDSALLRPGRCFDVLEFRKLTRVEAQAVLDEVGSENSLPDGSEFTLAEIFSRQPSEGTRKKKGMGFI